MRIKLDVSIRAPEITVPLNSLSHDIVVLDLGQLTLMNEFLSLDVGFSDEQSVALYEQYYIKLTELKLYRYITALDRFDSTFLIWQFWHRPRKNLHTCMLCVYTDPCGTVIKIDLQTVSVIFLIQSH